MQERKKSKMTAPTVDQINADWVTQLANQYWAPYVVNSGQQMAFSGAIVEQIYQKELIATGFAVRRVMLLEFSQYLENYLWPNYHPRHATRAHLLSIVAMVNEKYRERVPAWTTFVGRPEYFGAFFEQIMHTTLERVSFRELTALILFLGHCFNSMEVPLVRSHVQKLVSLPMWICLSDNRREAELEKIPKWRRFWRAVQKKDAALTDKERSRANFERRFIYSLIDKFLRLLDTTEEKDSVDRQRLSFYEHMLQLLIDLESLLPTRRFFNTLLDDMHVTVRCSLSPMYRRRDDSLLFRELLEMLQFYSRFEINDQTGDPLSDHDMMMLHYGRITSLQVAAFSKYPDLRDFCLANVASVDTRASLVCHFSPLTNQQLHSVAAFLHLLPPPGSPPPAAAAAGGGGDGLTQYTDKFLLELLVSRHERRASQLVAINSLPLYPTEKIIWDANVVPDEYFSGEGCLALPKLNLQFLTLHDYLLRNFNLFRLESTYEIRQDIDDVIFRLRPWKNEIGDVTFAGWARMAQPIDNFNIVEVAKPRVGERRPARVRADVSLVLNVRAEVRAEWEALRKHDVCFLLTIRPKMAHGERFDMKSSLALQAGVCHVRGCEVEGLLDQNGRVIEDGPEPRPQLPGERRTYRVWLDCNQYREDLDQSAGQEEAEDVYATFNVLMRRKPKENNFKAVLETMRELMNNECVVPDWLHDIVLGYGDPGAAHYSVMPNQIATMDWNDTFLDMQHLRDSFPNHSVQLKCPHSFAGKQPPKPPYRLTFVGVAEAAEKSTVAAVAVAVATGDSNVATTTAETPAATNAAAAATVGQCVPPDGRSQLILVEPHMLPSRGPYPYVQPKRNIVRFTPTQVEAIRAGMQPGLTMVVGPPGTGKTDVAVQIIANLYHNMPHQRTLIVTHSNQALNQLFAKIMALDIDERHLLRLGHGEEALETEKDFSRYGRVNFVLAKRLQLLDSVQRLQQSLAVAGEMAHTCETAGHFYMQHVRSRWQQYLAAMAREHWKTLPISAVRTKFPFSGFFADAPQPIFHGNSIEEDLEIAHGCYRYIERIFEQLTEFRAFELLRGGVDRSRYLLVKEARIVAMTCTHAALKRRELVQLRFQYDNILMEEAAQILEIETFIPLLLQQPQDKFNRLKRWIMIGDHHQLPPVIKNMAFQKYSNMEQSLFTRFVRLGVPTVQLDAQGRSRASICRLYNWRYAVLGNLAHVLQSAEYRRANAGFSFDYQVVDVQDFQGAGETEPSPYYYQNLAEAEYVVAVYMYMRLLGYPSEKITILTTYNGQKQLIRDVISQRCASNPIMGEPCKVDTVDKYQGQQNDYVLLSLVRSRAVGHLRDARRLVVAMSRARLGLYVFARVQLFVNCFELTPAFSLLVERPCQLQLIPDERYPCLRPVDQTASSAGGRPPVVIADMPQMLHYVYELYLHRIGHMTQQQQQMWASPGGGQTGSARASSSSSSQLLPRRAAAVHPGAGADSSDEDEEQRVAPPVGKGRQTAPQSTATAATTAAATATVTTAAATATVTTAAATVTVTAATTAATSSLSDQQDEPMQSD